MSCRDCEILYDELGVKPTEVTKTQFRKWMLIYHPDTCDGDNSQCSSQFQRVKNCYDKFVAGHCANRITSDGEIKTHMKKEPAEQSNSGNGVVATFTKAFKSLSLSITDHASTSQALVPFVQQSSQALVPFVESAHALVPYAKQSRSYERQSSGRRLVPVRRPSLSKTLATLSRSTQKRSPKRSSKKKCKRVSMRRTSAGKCKYRACKKKSMTRKRSKGRCSYKTQEARRRARNRSAARSRSRSR
jgi:hypothetical protein